MDIDKYATNTYIFLYAKQKKDSSLLTAVCRYYVRHSI